MPKIVLEIDIVVENYAEVVKQERGFMASFLSKIPLVGLFVEGKVDTAIKEELLKELPPAITREVAKGLGEKGIKAQVCVLPVDR